MTVTGYRLLLGLLGTVLVGSIFLAAPRPSELGMLPTVSCEEWWRRPEPSRRVRLEGCVVDLHGHTYRERSDGRGVEVALVKVRPPGWSPGEEAEPAEVLWLTDDPDILALVDRGRRAGEERAGERVIERYAAEWVRVRPIVGSIAIYRTERQLRAPLEADGSITARPWTIDGTVRSSAMRGIASVLIPSAFFAIALLMWLQRGWERRRLALTGKAAPVRF